MYSYRKPPSRALNWTKYYLTRRNCRTASGGVRIFKNVSQIVRRGRGEAVTFFGNWVHTLYKTAMQIFAKMNKVKK